MFILSLFMNPNRPWKLEEVLAFAKEPSFEPGKGWDAPDQDVTIVVLTNKNGVLVTPIVTALLEVAL